MIAPLENPARKTRLESTGKLREISATTAAMKPTSSMCSRAPSPQHAPPFQSEANSPLPSDPAEPGSYFSGPSGNHDLLQSEVESEPRLVNQCQRGAECSPGTAMDAVGECDSSDSDSRRHRRR